MAISVITTCGNSAAVAGADICAGLSAPWAAKNGWALAEMTGDLTPDGMRKSMNTTAWNIDGVRNDVCAYAVEQLDDLDGVSIVCETGSS
ncbi:hypothetical protein [Rhodococcus rhodochrous]|uniref:hypothetical protein n=1 Tax=Rhodococcus rhodochrous TaxID=1829 RepID=UPI0012FD1213|nr:hypothetical protein [Rhodococcus rhodochrous]